jgi:hypothetical protein
MPLDDTAVLISQRPRFWARFRTSLPSEAISLWSNAISSGSSSISNQPTWAASSPARILSSPFSAIPINATVICLPLGSRPHLPNVCICSSATFDNPVSSANSLATASSSSSSIPTNPPGRAHLPLYGSFLRYKNKGFVFHQKNQNTTASTVTVGLGQSYVYLPFFTITLSPALVLH